MRLSPILCFAFVCVGCELETPPPTQSDTVVVPYQFSIEFAVEQELGKDHIARARLYDLAQAYDITGNAGTIELSDGDTIWADDVNLDIETRTQFLTTLRVDYSETIPAGADDYLFEMRRPDDERIVATIPIPETFDVAPLEELEYGPLASVALTWDPPIDGATIDIFLKPLTQNCITILGGEETDVVRQLDDEGSFVFEHENYHSLEHDCEYELRFVRRTVNAVSGTWFTRGEELPASDVWAIGLHTERLTVVAKQR